ncbi:unnamed protein product [Bursaphelenchus xylophilus]|uniref:(pine wood nematode) hypothetical protein n=1 Tax=Bursaphelenchus xylophilus TaxID=6326 RepID=A0A7I8XJB0_BURXY|nr:unnamed protein product [Bursaphelenchus xylophilus]CAG9121189.1 unnamed protein product [Bursaphelenchus xylophilus]
MTISRITLGEKKKEVPDDGELIIPVTNPFRTHLLDLPSQRKAKTILDDHWYDSESEDLGEEWNSGAGEVLDQIPVAVYCEECDISVKTTVKFERNNFIKRLLVLTAILGFFTFGFTWILFLILLFVPGFKKTYHFCSICKKYFGVYNN